MNKPNRKEVLLLGVILLTIFVTYSILENWDDFKTGFRNGWTSQTTGKH